jgi:hypothetical protein
VYFFINIIYSSPFPLRLPQHNPQPTPPKNTPTPPPSPPRPPSRAPTPRHPPPSPRPRALRPPPSSREGASWACFSGEEGEEWEWEEATKSRTSLGSRRSRWCRTAISTARSPFVPIGYNRYSLVYVYYLFLYVLFCLHAVQEFRMNEEKERKK